MVADVLYVNNNYNRAPITFDFCHKCFHIVNCEGESIEILMAEMTAERLKLGFEWKT